MELTWNIQAPATGSLNELLSILAMENVVSALMNVLRMSHLEQQSGNTWILYLTLRFNKGVKLIKFCWKGSM